MISTQHNSLQLFKVHDYRGWNISRNIYLYPYFFPINFVNLVNHQHLNLLTWRVSELSLCLIAGDSLGKSLGRTEHSNTCLRQRESRKKKKKKSQKKKIQLTAARENKNTVFSLSLFRVTAWCWHVLHQAVRQCFAKAGSTPPSAHGQNPLRGDARACTVQISGQERARQPSLPWECDPP